MSEQDTEESEEVEEEVTTETESRWVYLGSVVSFEIISVFLVLYSLGVLGYADFTHIPSQWFYVMTIVVLAATGWVFGTDLLKAYNSR